MRSADRNATFDDILVEIFRELDSGGRPDVEGFVSRFPEFEGQIRGFLEDYDFVEGELESGRTRAEPAGNGVGDAAAGEIEAPDGSSDLPKIGQFTLLEELSAGGQGIVYRAQQHGTKRIVALKVIRAGALATAAERRRFTAEIEIISRLNHPNIVSVYECGLADGRDYFAMEFVDGESLDQYHAARSLEIEDSLRLYLQICDAVSYAHQHGVIHRDLKPSNVLIDKDGQAHVLDFGLARSLQDDPAHTVLTQVGDFAGTWHYASPEQARRDPALVDTRSDIYSLGVILYEMLTDFLPYPVSGEPPDAIARHITVTAPIPPRSVRRDLHDDLETIVLCALRKEPERRYQSVAALAEDIRSYLAGNAIAAKRDHALYVARKTIRRFRWQFAAGGTALIALIIYAVTFSVLYAEAKRANATIQVRTDLMRKSGRYLLAKLEVLGITANAVAEVAEEAPELPTIRRLRKPLREFPLELVAGVLADATDPILEYDAGVSEGDGAFARAWFEQRSSQLDEIEQLALQYRFAFIERAVSGTGLVYEEPAPGVAPPSSLSRLLIARASIAIYDQQIPRALRTLDAARSIAQDQGDDEWITHRASGILSRGALYDVVLTALSGKRQDPQASRELAEWILADPPLPTLHEGLIPARQRLAQLYEAATFARSGDSAGYIDADALNVVSGGGFPTGGVVTDELRELGRRTAPDQALQLVDLLMSAYEPWDDYSYARIVAARRELVERFNAAPAMPLVRPTVSSHGGAFDVRGQLRSKRAATMLGASLVVYHSEHGSWPRTLEDLPVLQAGDKYDPYVDAPFRYAVVDGEPRLYSLNVDGVDDNGAPGQWGQPRTDLVFLPFDQSLRSRDR